MTRWPFHFGRDAWNRWTRRATRGIHAPGLTAIIGSAPGASTQAKAGTTTWFRAETSRTTL